MRQITFSIDTGKFNLEDIVKAEQLAENYFEMRHNPGQLQATEEDYTWIHKHIPDCFNVIKIKDEIIGFTLIIPCNKQLMEQFLSKRVSESQLFKKIKESVTYDNFETIYLCSAFVKPAFRQKGLAHKAYVMSIEKIIKKRGIKPILFYWEFSEGGRKLASKVAQITKFKLIKRV